MKRFVSSFHLFIFLSAAVAPLFGLHLHLEQGNPHFTSLTSIEHNHFNHLPPQEIPEKNLLQYIFDSGLNIPDHESLALNGISADLYIPSNKVRNLYVPRLLNFSELSAPNVLYGELHALALSSRAPPLNN
ncbi:MAG: hypothetical protein KDK38_14365, partial [Leptospiraceae bacterium]|nr:hypothetical protein [Leptospiraceae bacterium]